VIPVSSIGKRMKCLTFTVTHMKIKNEQRIRPRVRFYPLIYVDVNRMDPSLKWQKGIHIYIFGCRNFIHSKTSRNNFW
jgi:hypothetical protein